MFRFKKSYFFLILIFLFLIYNCVFIYKRSFVINGERYFVLYDDMMVSMRYAKNLAHGYGLVWNPGGERVEGYTNLLWVLYMSLFHLLPIPASKISLFIQLSGVIFLTINLYVVRKIVETLFSNSNKAFFISSTAILLTAFYYPLNNWAVLGTEVSILTLLVSVIVWLVLKSTKSSKTPISLYLLLGIITLVRIDMALLSLVTIFFLTYINTSFALCHSEHIRRAQCKLREESLAGRQTSLPRLTVANARPKQVRRSFVVSLLRMTERAKLVIDKRDRIKHLTTGLTVILFFLFIQTLFRIIYYHDILPNTYYLKLVGYPVLLRISNGFYVFFNFIWKMNLFLFLLPFLLLLDKKMRHHLLFLYIVLAVQIIYSIYVGGDTFEVYGGSNRFISIIMPLFFVLFSISLLKLKDILSSFRKNNLLINAFLSTTILLSLISFNNIKNTRLIDYWLLLKEPVYGAKENVLVAQLIDKIITKNAGIAVTWAGTAPYFINRYYIDMLGKNDKIIGREKMRSVGFYPGHMKWDYQYSIDQLKPEVVILMYEDRNRDYYKYATPYLYKAYKKIKYRSHGIYVLI